MTKTNNKELLHIQLASFSEECQYPDRKKGLFFIHDFDFNGNGLCIPEDLANTYLDSLNGSPLVAYYNEVTEDLEGHRKVTDKYGNIIRLETDACGVLFNAHIDTHEINEEEKYGVWAEGYLWLRFENTLNVVQHLYETNNKVDISVEVQTGGYEYSEEGRTAQKYLNYFGTALLGSKISPAYKDAGMYALNNLEVAEAYQKDINKDVGGVNVKFAFKLEASDLSNYDMRKQMNEQMKKLSKVVMSKVKVKKLMEDISVNEIDMTALTEMADQILPYYTEVNDYFWMELWCPEEYVFDTYVVCNDCYSGKSFMFDYSVDGEQVNVSNPRPAKMQWIEANEMKVDGFSKEFSEYVKKNYEITNQLKEKETQLNSLTEEKTQLETKVQELSTKDTEINELKTQLETLQKELSTKDESLKMTETEANEKIIKLGESIEELKTQINTLIPIKEEYDKVQVELKAKETAEKQETLKQYALNSKMIEEKELSENEDIKKMIDELNESGIKSVIADRIVAKAKVELNTNDITLHINPEGKDLLPQSAKDLMYAPRKK